MKKHKYTGEEFLYDVHSFDIDIINNHIFLFGVENYLPAEDTSHPGIEFVMSNRFIRNLHILMQKSSEPILISMKTEGGAWEEGMAIYDAIKTCPNKICIINYTYASSMSSIVLQAADKRVMMPNSMFMFHDGDKSYSGTTKQFLIEAIELKKMSEQMMNIYTTSMKTKGKFSSWSKKRIYAWLREEMNKKEDVYLNAKQTVQYGFADEIFDGNWDGLLKF